MTPFEKLGYKVGDKFEVVVDYLAPGYAKLGDIATFYKDDNTHCPYFKLENGGIVCFSIGQISPLKTEAEKRGAKFGVGGVIKATGDKGVFWKSSSSYLGEEWYLFMNDGNILVIPSTQIRLDHEPEYKEIPFSEATHEQRMNVDNLVHVGGRKVEQIFRFNNDSYAFTYERDEVVYQSTSLVKVRVPT